jgi:hypothetical protein
MVVPEGLGSRPYAADPSLTGRWRGTLFAPERAIPVTIEFSPSAQILLQIDDGPVAAIASPEVENGLVQGTADATIPSASLGRHAYHVELCLGRYRDGLCGYAMAAATDWHSGFGLPFYVELKRSNDVVGRGSSSVTSRTTTETDRDP